MISRTSSLALAFALSATLTLALVASAQGSAQPASTSAVPAMAVYPLPRVVISRRLDNNAPAAKVAEPGGI